MLSPKSLEEWPLAGLEDWIKAVSASAPPEEWQKALHWQDEEGLALNALYLLDSGVKPLRINSNRKSFPALIQWLWWREEEDFLRHWEEAVSSGADAVEIFGEFPSDTEFFRHILAALNPDATELWFDFGESNSALPFILYDELSHHLVDPDRLKGGLNYDPLTALAFTGKHDISEADTSRTIKAVLSEGGKALPKFKMTSLNAAAFHEAGAFSSLELAIALALADAYVQVIEPADPASFFRQIHLRLASGRDFYSNLVKFLAFNVLWRNYAEALNIEAEAPYCIAVISRCWYSAFDVHNNLVRQTLQILAAILGGCDAVLVEPFDIVKQLPERKSYRLTRNIHLLLKKESDLSECLSLSEGSLFFEQYAGKMAEKAWEIFTDIQKQGGYLKALYSGYIQRQVERNLEQRLRQLSQKEIPVIGATHYVNQYEKVTELPPLPFRYPPAARRTDFETLQEKQFLRKLDELRIARVEK
jgi:methylmalonyl-CoA mutase